MAYQLFINDEYLYTLPHNDLLILPVECLFDIQTHTQLFTCTIGRLEAINFTFKKVSSGLVYTLYDCYFMGFIIEGTARFQYRIMEYYGQATAEGLINHG